MAVLPIGSVKTAFNRSYVLISNENTRGFEEWRPTNVPVDEAAFGLFGILPILTTENINTGDVNVAFNIAGLAEMGTRQTAEYETDWLKASRKDKRFLPKVRDLSATVSGTPPIRAEQNKNVAVLLFAPDTLEEIPINNPSNFTLYRNQQAMKVQIQSYNRDNAASLSATAPMAESTIGGDSNFSFDISALSSV